MSFGQAPSGMSYQGVVRDSGGALVVSQAVGMQISILLGSTQGSAVYRETQLAITNANGLVSLEIGTGSTTDDFSAIDWSSGSYFIKTETDPTGGNNYSIVGTSQLMSMPYALYAKTSGSSIAGAAGTNGIDGAIGAAGPQGATGTSGADGTNGATGAQGIQGLIGLTGAAGTNGLAGIDGATGIAGTNGADGATGLAGAAGIQGDAGASGEDGADGTNGADGATGLAGAAGIQGDAGASGEDGADGTNGTNGVQGIQGEIGVSGTNGVDGATGDNGADGATGATGLTTSVNAIVQLDGKITLTTTDIPEGDKKYYTESLVSANASVAANTAKEGITSAQATNIIANTANIAREAYQNEYAIGELDRRLSVEEEGLSDAVRSIDRIQYLMYDVSSEADRNEYSIGELDRRLLVVEERSALATGPAGAQGPIGGYPVHTIGESYGGGIVFYVYDGGQHGLIAAVADQSYSIIWYGGTFTNTRARADGVGAGLKNTAIIIANQGSGNGEAFAATVCNEYSVTVGGVTYGDWYLPSKHELNLLYLQKNVVGGFTNSSYYWSSTETSNLLASIQYFGYPIQANSNKSVTNPVRAVRAF
jgi:hypothetical protein